jgi:NAD(P)-dependent dehydrogenase (short-subunit alcohol dehydrogenase family)
LRDVKQEIESSGGTAAIFPLDIADADAVIDAADSIVMATGSIDIWINDAMVTVFSPVDAS